MRAVESGCRAARPHRKRHTVDDGLGETLLGRRQPVLAGEPSDRRALHVIRIDQHQQHRAGAELRHAAPKNGNGHIMARSGAAPEVAAARCRRDRLGVVRLPGGGDRGTFANGGIERACSRLVDAA